MISFGYATAFNAERRMAAAPWQPYVLVDNVSPVSYQMPRSVEHRAAAYAGKSLREDFMSAAKRSKLAW